MSKFCHHSLLIMPEFKRPESILVIVYARDSSVLLLQRKDWPDFWQSVTGSMQDAETSPLISAWRELKEETGLSATDGDMQDCQASAYFDIYPQWLKRYAPGVTRNLEHVFCFRVAKPINISISKEHTSYCWVTKEEALEKVISSTNSDAIDKYVP